MIRQLRRLFEWLDSRFPAKVTVTEQAFDALCAREHKHAKSLDAIRQEFANLRSENDGLRESVNAIKDLIAKGGLPVIQAEKRRASFINSGRMED